MIVGDSKADTDRTSCIGSKARDRLRRIADGVVVLILDNSLDNDVIWRQCAGSQSRAYLQLIIRINR